MLRLNCVAQQYDWGKTGGASAVAQLKSKGEGVPIDEAAPYAEYWFGTHTSGPSRVALPGGADVPLQDWLLAHPAALGAPPYSATSALPYLFKVLSVAKALSVQAHPDKRLAERLHAARPDLYKDDNHKPEMACALTPFEAMCGFRPPAEIVANVRRVPELAALVGAGAIDALAAATDAMYAMAGGDPHEEELRFKATLRAAFTAFMCAPEAAVAAQTAALAARLAAAAPPAAAATTAGDLAPDAVAARLCGQFPGDVGVFAPYWLNTLRLQPGQAIFLGANDPHAYLDGDCIEVMACSDNVVRAGLTPKLKDTGVLCEMLTYACGAPAVDAGRPLDACTRSYVPPVSEFTLQRTELGGGPQQEYALPAIPSAAILVVVRGRALASSPGAGGEQEVSEGHVFLQPAGVPVSLRLAPDSPAPLLLFRAHANAGAAASSAGL